MCVCARVLSRVWLFTALWTRAIQAPLQGTSQARLLEWVAICYLRESLPNTGIKPASLEPPALGRRTLYHFTRQEALKQLYCKWGRKKDLTSTWFSNGPLHIQSHDLGQIHRLEKCTLYFDKLHFKKTAIVRWNGPLQPCFLPHLSRSVFLFYFSAWHLQVIKIILGINLATPL